MERQRDHECESGPSGQRTKRHCRTYRHRHRFNARRPGWTSNQEHQIGRTQSGNSASTTQSAPTLPNTDQLYGHGTFVAGVIAGGGNLSGGKYSGCSAKCEVGGLSAGDLNLFYVLEGFDYLLANDNSLGVRVVNCSFSTNALFDFDDPVNVATKMLTDAGVNVVFSAGNNGPGQHTLNPYAARRGWSALARRILRAGLQNLARAADSPIHCSIRPSWRRRRCR